MARPERLIRGLRPLTPSGRPKFVRASVGRLPRPRFELWSSNVIQSNKRKRAPDGALCLLARPERFELPTAWFVARYSIQLSYGRFVWPRGAPGGREIIETRALKCYAGGAMGANRSHRTSAPVTVTKLDSGTRTQASSTRDNGSETIARASDEKCRTPGASSFKASVSAL